MIVANDATASTANSATMSPVSAVRRRAVAAQTRDRADDPQGDVERDVLVKQRFEATPIRAGYLERHTARVKVGRDRDRGGLDSGELWVLTLTA